MCLPLKPLLRNMSPLQLNNELTEAALKPYARLLRTVYLRSGGVDIDRCYHTIYIIIAYRGVYLVFINVPTLQHCRSLVRVPPSFRTNSHQTDSSLPLNQLHVSDRFFDSIMLPSHTAGVGKAAALTLVFTSLFWVYGTRNFYRDPGSIFFDITKAFERSYSRYREAEALSFRDEALLSLSKDHSDARASRRIGSPPSICAIIVSFGREPEGGSGVYPLEARLSPSI